MNVPEKLNCWEHRKCGEKECPAYNRKDVFCWALSGNKACLNGLESSNVFKKCLACDVFRINALTDPANGFMGLINQLYIELEKSEAQHLLFRKINSLIQSTIELDKTLHVILTCVTAGYGLGFNRALLLMNDETGNFLEDRMMVAPASKEEAYRIWQDLAQMDVTADKLPELVNIYENGFKAKGKKYKPGKLVMSLSESNIFTQCIREKNAMLCDYKYKDRIPKAFLSFWGAEYFAVAPVLSGQKVRGLIVADNFVNNQEISGEHINLLSGFAYHAGLAIENALLYENLEKRAKELSETNERLVEARQILMRTEKLTVMGEMAATVAHEMRTPLISIGGFAQIVKDKVKDDPEIYKHMEIVVGEVKRLENIIRDVLDFVRPFELTLTGINVKKVIESAVLITESGRKIKGNISVSVAGDLSTINGDEERLKQVLINLLDNALDSGKGSRVNVSANKEGSKCILEIRDEGSGIKSEYFDKVLQPFFTTKKNGIGLGLPIAEKIIREHKGTLTINKQDIGVIVRIELPLDASTKYEVQGTK